MDLKYNKDYWFPESLVYKVDRRESDTLISPSLLLEKNTIYAITINPNPNKRIALPIPGQKSICRLYKNYTNSEQETVLLALLEPIKHLTYSGDVCFENTSFENRHIHTVVVIPKDLHHNAEVEALCQYVTEVRKRCTDSKQKYVCMDCKELTTLDDYDRWILYIHKDGTA